jgi:hypothetical protein
MTKAREAGFEPRIGLETGVVEFLNSQKGA